MESETVILRHPTNYSVKTAFFHQKSNFLYLSTTVYYALMCAFIKFCVDILDTSGVEPLIIR